MSEENLFAQYSDTEIASRVAAGETAMYEILIRRYNGYLYKTGRSYGFDHEDTQDLMQETYINAYMHLHQFENRSSFKTWLIKIMLNNCYRKKQKTDLQQQTSTAFNEQENIIPMFTTQDSDTGNTVLHKELVHVLENSLQRIPTEYRMVFSLRELNGFNTAETSEALSISESNVKVRLNRAKAMLRNEIEKIYTPEDIFEFNRVYCDRMVKVVMEKLREA
jgi:RNA polymerase sigma factor (sigma-70 family)